MIRSTINDAARRGARFRPAVACVTWAIVAGAAPARAEPVKSDPAAAEALFKAGRDLVKQGDYAAGCPKFEAALALNPSAGTMLNIARCHEHEGKLATAWEDYHRAQTLNRETAGAARKRELDDIAIQGIKDLEPRLPRLRVVVTAPPAGMEVSRDGKDLPSAAWGEALPVDPGKHEVSARAPGHKPRTAYVTLEEGKTSTVEIALEVGTTPSGGVPVWAWIAGGAGLALVGVSAYFIYDHQAAIDALHEHCDVSYNGTYCASGYDYGADNGRKNLDFGLALGLGSAGVLALGAAVYGIATAPRSKSAEPQGVAVMPWVAPGAGGAWISGRF
ncbi:PEGA domain-containing protein [Polyangium sp. 6x1]|uniref:PEGA domain-containing protein n=1 Tax=Polyangium sp. 6x1 TaxID=3042689 RepID=UPI002482ED66|nr:PEGA domain-containing protein [Polyangium sp. 6x1]MDI1445984.1 PEGA domain-containing protein [Polyangium sp. 6x1]